MMCAAARISQRTSRVAACRQDDRSENVTSEVSIVTLTNQAQGLAINNKSNSRKLFDDLEIMWEKIADVKRTIIDPYNV